MNAEVRLADIIAQFDSVLESPDPTSPLTIQANRLRARLTSDVRIALLGLPGSGKSTLAALLGQLAEVSAGQKLPRLQRVTLIDAPTGPTIEDQQAMCDRAIAGADILIWCTQHFGAVEQMVWRRVPEEKKDHAFLALTKADLLHRSGALLPRLAALEEVAVEDFLGIFPVATLQAAEALARVPEPDFDAFRASGGRTLAEEIARHVAQGRRCDIDNALLFLRKNAATTFPAATAAKAPEAEGRAQQEAPESASEQLSRPAADHAPVAEPAPVGPAFADLEPEVADPSLLNGAAQQLRDCGTTLLGWMGGTAPAPLAQVLDLCAETLEDLSDMVAAHEESGLPLSPVHEDILEAADMMLLLRLEDGADAAEDAAALLLQLRREIDVAAAA